MIFKTKKLKDWNDITLRDWTKMEEIIKRNDEFSEIDLIAYLYGQEVENMPYGEFKQKYGNALEFLHTEVPKVKIHKTYKLNGRKYNSNFKLTEVKTAQFMDYMEYAKNPTPEKLLSVFFTPKGHKYNDGYDLETVQNDLLDLDLPTVLSACFFFVQQLRVYAEIIQFYLIDQTKMMTKEQRQVIKDSLKQMDLDSLVSYLSYYSIVE